MSHHLKNPMFAPLDLSQKLPAMENFREAGNALDVRQNFENAMKVWRDSVEIHGTLAEKYLRKTRGITCDLAAGALRFNGACFHGPTKTRHPAMIALYTGAATNKAQGIHRTFLKQDGSGKADIEPQRLTLGNSLGAVVRLVDDVEITHGLGLAEGIETALSVMSMGWTPVWAGLSATNMAHFPVLDGVTLTIFSDNDPPDENGKRPGPDSARACAERWAATGKEAFIQTPLEKGDDWNDVLRKMVK